MITLRGLSDDSTAPHRTLAQRATQTQPSRWVWDWQQLATLEKAKKKRLGINLSRDL